MEESKFTEFIYVEIIVRINFNAIFSMQYENTVFDCELT